MGTNNENIKLYLFLEIFNVVSIEDNINLFRPKFQVSIKWQDQRLRFKNLRKDKESPLSPHEYDIIWKPVFLWDEVNQVNRRVILS